MPAVLAIVNGVAITSDDVTLKIGDHGDPADGSFRAKAVDALIAEELMFQKAVKLGFDKDPKFQQEVRMMEERIVAYKRAEMGRRVRDTQIASRVTVTDQEVKDYYAKHADEIGTDLRLGVLQFNDRNEADEALSRIRSGTPFEKIAAEQFSQAPKDRKRSWDKGFLHWNQMPAAFTDKVYRLKKGAVSGVLSSMPSEAYLVKVLDRRRNSAENLESTKAMIENKIWAAKGKAAYEQYIAQMKSDAVIKRN